MSNDLEKFIRKNRNDFDDAKPSGEVWKNIEKTLPVKKQAKRFTITDIYKWSAAAAIFFIALTSVYFLFIRKYSHEVPPTVKTGTEKGTPDLVSGMSIEFAAEIKQANEAVRNKQEELRSAIASDPVLYHKFQADLNALDSSYKVLREQANQSVNPDVIIKAMIDNLRLQSELLGRQLMIIHEIKTTKTSNNEKNI